MKKFIITPLLIILIISSGFPNLAFANNTIKVFVNGVELQTDQPPIVKNGRTLVPLRAIFEALNATVVYEEGTRKITAWRNDRRIILYINFNQALVNNKQIALDVPPQVVNNRTLVPVRFISEALGDQVYYNSSTRSVHVTRDLHPLSNVAAKDIANFGDGRDLEISFNKAENETWVNEYRIMVVKTSKANKFDLDSALRVSSSNYTSVPKVGRNIQRALNGTSRDTDGAMIESEISYTVFVLQHGIGSRPDHFLAKSAPITLGLPYKVPAITNLTVQDVFDYGDGRDFQVNFTKIPDETRLLHYRAIVVPTTEASMFNLSAAKEVTSANYTLIYRTGENIVSNLIPRDYLGRTIENGVSYRVFILSVGNSTLGFGSSLSPPSAQITLASRPNDIRASGITVKDIFDYGDGRDLDISFKIPTQEIRVSEYRIMIVPGAEANNFNLQKANLVSSPNYTTVSKTGTDRSVKLLATARDVNGNLIRSNTNYRVFVLSVGSAANGFSNSLSTPSSTISLTDNFRPAAISNLNVYDISDFRDGRDLQVRFNKVLDESVVSEYRVIIVKSAQANTFTVNDANILPVANYTSVAKTGSNFTVNLNANTRDANGALIREGVEYRAFVLSVSTGGNPKNNALSGSSASIVLTMNTFTQAAFNVAASDVGDAGNGSDLEVRFMRVAIESAILEYRIMVVKSNSTLNLAAANAVPSSRYTAVTPTGWNIVHRLSETARDVDGDLIEPDVEYIIYVLSVSNSTATNALSFPSANITLNVPKAGTVSNIVASDIGNNGNGQDLQVNFNRAVNETNIAYYAVMLVPETEASSFTLASANLVPREYFTRVNKTGNNLGVTLESHSTDVRGNTIANNVTYRVFVLSIADGINATVNGLASATNTITLVSN